jgi:pectinesterase
VWSHRGWKTSLTSASHDRGIDVIAVTDGVVSRKEAIQVKRYQSDKITSREVREYASIPNQEGDIDNVIIVTSSSFSQPAQEVADDLNVKTVDADDLYTIITENGLFPSLSEYITIPDNFGTDNDKKTTPRSTENRESKRVSGQNRNDKTKKHSDSAPVADVNEPSETTSSLTHKLATLGVVVILLIAVMTLIGLFTLNGGQKTLVVDHDGTTEYSSIQTAIDDSSAGDTVEIRPGTYAETVVVNKNITVTAPDSATLDGTNVEDPDMGVTIGSDEFDEAESINPTIRGLTITRYETGIRSKTDGGWTVSDVTVHTTEFSGIDASDSSSDWTIRDSEIVSVGSSGIDATSSDGDWTVENTVIRRTGTNGIYASGTSGDWTVRNVSVQGAFITASDSDGNWVIKQSSVGDRILADNSDGKWKITQSVITGDVPIDAERTLGGWSISRSIIHRTSTSSSDPAINAEGATAEGIATSNWWEGTSGPDVDACVGNVDCSDPLTKRPRGVGFNSSDEE